MTAAQNFEFKVVQNNTTLAMSNQSVVNLSIPVVRNGNRAVLTFTQRDLTNGLSGISVCNNLVIVVSMIIITVSIVIVVSMVIITVAIVLNSCCIHGNNFHSDSFSV